MIINQTRMRMFGTGMVGRSRDADMSFSTCVSTLPFGYKFFFILSCCFIPFCVFSISYVLYNVVYPAGYTQGEFHFWNLITSITVSSTGWMSIPAVLISFLWLYFMMPGLEEKYSTAYIILYVLLEHLLLSVSFAIVGFAAYMLGLEKAISYGWDAVILALAWKNVAHKPEEMVRFCFLPCMIKNKYIPWLITLIFMVFSKQVTPCLSACVLSYFQYMVVSSDLLVLPMGVFKKIDNLLPASITDRTDYTKVSKVEDDLRRWACGGRVEQFQEKAVEKGDKVQVLGGGVAVGGASQDFRGIWKEKNDQMRETDQIQIEPLPKKERYVDRQASQSKSKEEKNAVELIQKQQFKSAVPNESDVQLFNHQEEPESRANLTLPAASSTRLSLSNQEYPPVPPTSMLSVTNFLNSGAAMSEDQMKALLKMDDGSESEEEESEGEGDKNQKSDKKKLISK